MDYSLLIDIIEEHYKDKSLASKITRLCRECKIKIYRFKRIIESTKNCYFNVDEIIRIKKVLNINNIEKVFFTEKAL